VSGFNRAIGYPTNRLLAVIDDATAGTAAIAELQASGIATRDLEILRGEEGADRMDGTGGVSGWLGRLRRAFDFTLMDQLVDFAAYDLFQLKRHGAELDYPPERIAAARARFKSMSEMQQNELEHAIIAGLPGAESSYNRQQFRESREEWNGIAPDNLRSALVDFLKEVVPVAEELGIRLAIHPDDPPWPLFGLPRVVSTASDARSILGAIDSPANGLTFCVGSYGARPDNDLLAMIDEFAPRIHFAHLRQVVREADGSFYEAEHLRGSSDMVGVIRALLREESRRRRARRPDHQIPMRPDHGHLLADDINKKTNPGYSYIGRLKGLAELRGVMEGLRYANSEFED
jgi:mannonate dehydratase